LQFLLSHKAVPVHIRINHRRLRNIRALYPYGHPNTRILKIARTIADLEGLEGIATPHISEVIQHGSLDRALL
jgi:predicted ATPase with chaperone activity